MVTREVDYEISSGRYTLIITATDQCPIPQLRLTSSATVSDDYEHPVLYRGTIEILNIYQHICSSLMICWSVRNGFFRLDCFNKQPNYCKALTAAAVWS